MERKRVHTRQMHRTLNGMGATMTMKLTLIQRHKKKLHTAKSKETKKTTHKQRIRIFALYILMYFCAHTQNETLLVPHGNDNSF